MGDLESPSHDAHDLKKGLADDDASSGPYRLRRLFFRMTASCLCGVVCGFALEKGRVFQPGLVRDQMTWNKLALLKMYISACAVSMFSFSILSVMPHTHRYMSYVIRMHRIRLVDKGLVSSMIGGSLLGAGMMLSGASPGLALAQVGSKVDSSAFTRSYTTVIAQIPFLHQHRHFLRFRKGLGNWWQVSYCCGVVVGTFLSAVASESVGSVTGVPSVSAFFGGVLLLFGSSLAGGCDSGHGISGLALMAEHSIVAVPAIFLGGGITATIMKSWL
ncbi:hypothetical protein BaRGS_00006071 [Batillaria attramentaria]|uniref:Sulphur transport domain-containing protein n=1 Tax=Batillaria attramentaria TaxID=370345 RepID=A0ABD0LU97_9CAEN